MGNRILVLDDPNNIDLAPLADAFQQAAGDLARVEVVSTREELFTQLKKDLPHLVVIEDQVAGNDRGCLDVLCEIRKDYKDLPVVAVIHKDNHDLAVELLEAGVTDYIFRGDDMVLLVATELRKVKNLIGLIEDNRRLKARYEYLQSVERSRYMMIGESPQIAAVQEKISRVAVIPRPVLIIGERGTGKELVARAIHEAGRRRGDLVAINCAAFSDELLESELFGHEAGAFTGANRRASGKFEQADGGTLFLDEIGNMSLSFQQKIMRVVEYRSFRRVGGNKEIQVDVRVIAATNADLKKMMEEGKFLRDLYDRLTFEVIHVPALREREGDIETLARFFLHKFMEEIPDFRGKRFSTEALDELKRYDFPGNIRELKNIVERAVYRDTTNQIAAADMGLEPRVSDRVEGTNFKEKCEAFEIHLIQDALDQASGNQAEAARALGLTYHQLRHFIKKYGARLTV